MCVTATRRRAQVRPSGGWRELCTAAFLRLHSPLVDDTPAWPMSLLLMVEFGFLFPVACCTGDMLSGTRIVNGRHHYRWEEYEAHLEANAFKWCLLVPIHWPSP